MVMPPRFQDNGAVLSKPATSSEMEAEKKNFVIDHDAQVQGSNKLLREDSNEQKNKINKQSMDYVIRSGIAGGLAGCAAKTVVGPLDRVKILFQASSPQFAKYSGSWLGLISAMRQINQQDGLRGLFRGHSATLLRIFPYAGIKFLAYEQFRAIMIANPEQETPLRRLLSGSLAGVTSVFFTYPLEIIRVRLAFETKRDARASLSGICNQIYHEHPPRSSIVDTTPPTTGPVKEAAAQTLEKVTPRSGLVNFYRGFSPTLVGMFPYAGMSFLTHDTVGDWLRYPSLAPYTTLPLAPTDSPSRPRLNNPAQLTAGAAAGLVSQSVSYPLEVIRRRMQVGGAVGSGRMLSMRETAAIIWAERGFGGFFVGLGIGYIKILPMVALSFWVYERGKGWLGI